MYVCETSMQVSYEFCNVIWVFVAYYRDSTSEINFYCFSINFAQYGTRFNSYVYGKFKSIEYMEAGRFGKIWQANRGIKHFECFITNLH